MIPPKQNAAFVAAMEDILDVYQRPYDAKRPVVNMDGDIVKCCGWRRAHPDGLSGGFDVSVLKFNALEDEFNEFVTV